MRYDGTHIEQLTDKPVGRGHAPSWQPSGMRQIAAGK